MLQVVLAANDLPSINDVTYPELLEIISKVVENYMLIFMIIAVSRLNLTYYLLICQLKDEHGHLVGVDTSNLLIANSGNDLPVRRGNCLIHVMA